MFLFSFVFGVAFLVKASVSSSCATAQYQDPLSLKCSDCTMCDIGYGVSHNCTQTNDTICEKCPKGYGSLRKDYQKCELIRVVERNADNNKNIWRVVIFVLLLLLFLSVCGLARWLYRRRRRRKAHDNDRHSSLVYSEIEIPLTAVRHSEAGYSSGYSSQSSIASDALVMLASQDPPLHTKNLPVHIWGMLGALLNPSQPGKDWLTVAGHLSYTSTDVMNAKLNQNHAFFEELMNDYMTRADATVLQLYKVLQRIGHGVACKVLMDFVVSYDLAQKQKNQAAENSTTV